ncbi:MAG: hypothetical protein JXB14_06905, partial [Candidatus Altiarchaeota archaeon]|nr:hypothetical protein [Candidatus Altiarchaeota archaeon]
NKKFSEEFNTKMIELSNELELLSSTKLFNLPKNNITLCLLMTNFCFTVLPFSNFYKTKYLMFGNEQSCNDSYHNKDGFRCFPVFDQSSDWTVQLDNVSQIMTNGLVNTCSIVEPIHEIAIMKILHSRYSDMGKYQMSCFTENENAKRNHWCQSCSKCARMFIFMKALNIDPRQFGYDHDLLAKENRDLYSLFGVRDHNGSIIGYDRSGTGRDEQLLSFYMAYKNGVRGDLMEVFKEMFLQEAIEREDELYRRFFSVYEPKTIPSKIKSDILSILNEELGNEKPLRVSEQLKLPIKD